MKKIFLLLISVLLLMSGCKNSYFLVDGDPLVFESYDEYKLFAKAFEGDDSFVLAESFQYLGEFYYGEYNYNKVYKKDGSDGGEWLTYYYKLDEDDSVFIIIKNELSKFLPNTKRYFRREYGCKIRNYKQVYFEGNDLSRCKLNDGKNSVAIAIGDAMYVYTNGELSQIELRHGEFLFSVYNEQEDGTLADLQGGEFGRLLNYETAEEAIQEFKDAIITAGDKK